MNFAPSIAKTQKPGAVSRPGANREFQFHELCDLQGFVKSDPMCIWNIAHSLALNGRRLASPPKEQQKAA
jgi:hypothetical protein